ncbi:MAG: phosphate ABC transporter substrate-binding protein [Anaerolineales bacterium]|nr:phosphate ABC transporter substrate-binding protein [Anaerolineales bacterium]
MTLAMQPTDLFWKGIGTALCLMGLLLFVGCAGRAVEPPEPVHLKVAGSTSMQPLVEELAQAYAERHKHVTIAVEGRGSLLGIEMVRQGQVDIGMASWKESEDTSAVSTSKLWSTPIALDGIAIVVHPENRVEGLTMLQLKDVFFGRIWDWKDVRGQAGEILVVSREDGSGTRAVFEDLVMQGKRVTPTAVVMPSSRAVVEYVAEHPEAIGYVSMGYVSEEVKVLEIEEAAPTPKSVRQGEYHLFSPLFLITRQEPTDEIKGFVDFVLSPTGQSIVGRKYGRVKGS